MFGGCSRGEIVSPAMPFTSCCFTSCLQGGRVSQRSTRGQRLLGGHLLGVPHVAGALQTPGTRPGLAASWDA